MEGAPDSGPSGLGYGGLTRLLMVPIETYGKNRGSQKIEDDDIDIRMSLDQGEHRIHSLAGVASFSPSGRALIAGI